MKYTLTIHKFFNVIEGEEAEAAKAGVALSHGVSSIFLGGSDPAALAAFATRYVERQAITELLRGDPWGQAEGQNHVG